MGVRGVNLLPKRAQFGANGGELVAKARVFLGANSANLVQKRVKKLVWHNRNDATSERGFLSFAFFIYLDSAFLALQLLASGFYSI